MEIDKDNLEKALSGKKGAKKSAKKDAGQEMPKETEIGFHQGALNTLVAERNELFKMIQNVEAIMQAHLKRLEELGVKIETKGKK
jgi:hypothetical protein